MLLGFLKKYAMTTIGGGSATPSFHNIVTGNNHAHCNEQSSTKHIQQGTPHPIEEERNVSEPISEEMKESNQTAPNRLEKKRIGTCILEIDET
jgi:hypothetical protein